MKDELLIKFDPWSPNIQVTYADSIGHQWLLFPVEAFFFKNFTQKESGIIEIKLSGTRSYVADKKHFGLIKPDFQAEDLLKYLPIDSRYFWYYTSGFIYHSPEIHNLLEAKESGLHNDIFYYETHEALRVLIRCGYSYEFA